MNTTYLGIVRHKALIEEFYHTENRVNLCGLLEWKDSIFVCSHAGEILQISENRECRVYSTLKGQPNGLAYFEEDNLYFADIANATIFSINSKNNENNDDLEIVAKDYEDFPLKGPTSICLYQDAISLIVCDAGYFGTTNLNNANGSVYIIDLENKIVRPLLLNCLSYPSDICINNEEGKFYICETFKNRILRVVQNPFGTYHTSVFHQFCGRVGPTAICVGNNEDIYNYIFVARYEYQNNENSIDGIISILNKEGNLIGEMILPTFPEITSILISKNKEYIYFTERNNSGIYRAKLSGLIDEIKKYEDLS